MDDSLRCQYKDMVYIKRTYHRLDDQSKIQETPLLNEDYTYEKQG